MVEIHTFFTYISKNLEETIPQTRKHHAQYLKTPCQNYFPIKPTKPEEI